MIAHTSAEARRYTRNVPVHTLHDDTRYLARRFGPAKKEAAELYPRMALPLAITVVVVTEMIGDSAGLGYYINIAGARFRFAYVYAGILMVGIIGLALDGALMLLRRRLIHWKPEEGAI